MYALSISQKKWFPDKLQNQDAQHSSMKELVSLEPLWDILINIDWKLNIGVAWFLLSLPQTHYLLY